MDEILKKIGDLGIVPVVKIDNPGDAVPLGRALLKAKLPIAEITFRTAAAEESIINITKELPELLVGAGTVLTVKQAQSAVNAGAKFIVSPGFNKAVVEFCIHEGITVTPGCSSPTDMETALTYNLDVVKFFPAEAFGGLKTLKAISGPYGMIKFIPTGGIDIKNINDYLNFDKVLACGGSWMVKDELIKSGNFDEITRLAKEVVDAILGFEIGHIGINTVDAETSMSVAKRISSIFNLPVKEGNSSNFISTGIEVNKSIGLGKNGHIAIKTKSISRAISYMNRNGVEIDMSTAKGPEGGPIAAVYLKEEIGGFAIHLLQSK